MVDDSKAFKLVGANHDPTPLVLAFHSSCGDSSATPLLPFSLSLSFSRSFRIYSSPSFVGSLSLETLRPGRQDNSDRHLATSGGSIALRDLHENLLWNFHRDCVDRREGETGCFPRLQADRSSFGLFASTDRLPP